MPATPTYRRWATAYATAATLLAGWLFLEKMPDGREELARSVERTFWESGEVVVEFNNKTVAAIRAEEADYPSPKNREYKNRAEKAVAMAPKWREGTTDAQVLAWKDSLVLLADKDELISRALEETLGKGLPEKYKSLKTNRLEFQFQALTQHTVNYCASKVVGFRLNCWPTFTPGFIPSTLAPKVGEPFSAEVILSGYDDRCANFTCFFNDRPQPLKEGIATLRTTFTTPGQHTLRLRFRRERCRDGSVTEISRDFRVNVLERCVEE
jgi:hypothetical protein